ncbi:hypothetical protein KIM372_04360 [Bombiscardovia nodaiensis]|uniref:Uncharacterized protein n=1 Tax=Bombiscardovia nodaiensis TaxID=2932181 RepID=A0ABM8B6Q5_9BIFI|nr:hypothetical protein KIM372_04360 [Bombiscardovia nodaiensis]
MKKSLIALAAGAFALGAAEFVMMGILPQTAHAMSVSIPQAGHFISSYAIGVCVGTLMLVFGRKLPPKSLVLIFMVLIVVGNTFSALSANAGMLIVARFIAGLPHGAFFGTAAYIAKLTAEPGKEAQAMAVTVTGQTVANMLGVPGAPSCRNTCLGGPLSHFWPSGEPPPSSWSCGGCPTYQPCPIPACADSSASSSAGAPG